jgi:hypothetical protein
MPRSGKARAVEIAFTLFQLPIPACLLHSIVDIVTHVNDGLLLLFPLNWTLRFQSSISYWDARHYGSQFQQFEIALDGLLMIYLLSGRIHRLLYRNR